MRARDGLVGSLTSIATMAGAALVPKCPMCIAAWLCALGVSAEAAKIVAPFARSGAFVLAAALVVVAALVTASAIRNSRSRARCCRK